MKVNPLQDLQSVQLHNLQTSKDGQSVGSNVPEQWLVESSARQHVIIALSVP